MTLKERLAKQFADYPKIAIITYLVLSLSAIIGFSVAIAIGAEASSATGMLGVIGAGWLAAKATMPLRILATLAITPLVATLVKRLRRRRPIQEDEVADDEPVSSEPAPEPKPQA